MTLGDAIFEVLLQVQQLSISVSVSRPTVKLYMNEALQYTRRIAEASDYLFYTKSASFSGTTIAYTADFKNMIEGGIIVPLATDGQARIPSNRQYITMGTNNVEKGTTANPVARLNAANWSITPTSAGTWYYLFNFGNVDDEETELTDLIPWVYEELVILKTVEFLLLRHFMIMEPKAQELNKEIDISKQAYMALYKRWMPQSEYREEQPTPATLAILPQQSQN